MHKKIPTLNIDIESTPSKITGLVGEYIVNSRGSDREQLIWLMGSSHSDLICRCPVVSSCWYCPWHCNTCLTCAELSCDILRTAGNNWWCCVRSSYKKKQLWFSINISWCSRKKWSLENVMRIRFLNNLMFGCPHLPCAFSICYCIWLDLNRGLGFV